MSQKPNQTAIISGGRKKVHTTYPDASEMVEEYDLKSDALLVRKSRKKPPLGGEGEWTFEVGEAVQKKAIVEDGMFESSSNPVMVRLDSKTHFQFRIRNLPYPKDVYKISIDDEKNQIVLRTENKKYFKRISITDMDRAELTLEAENISWSHANNTLIINYEKPPEILERESQQRRERQKLKTVDAEEGDVDCKQQ